MAAYVTFGGPEGNQHNAACSILEDKAEALGELQSALALGEPGGFIMTFVSKGKPVADLLEEIVAVKKKDRDVNEAGFSLSYAKKLLSVFKAGTPSSN